MKTTSFTSLISLSLFALSSLPTTFAHGFVKEVTIGGKSYKGVMTGRGNGGNSGVVRKINSAEPNHIQDTTAIPCGPGANTRFSTDFASAKPGDTVSLMWDGGSGHSRWPHELGPMVNYIAECKVAGCKDDASKLVFYKIDNQGLKADQSANSNGGSWFQKDLMSGKPATVKLPAGLANGEYILRHEIIALHEGSNPKMGPEFYPSCVNIKVTGGQGSKFSASGDGVTFPAGYKTSSIGNKELTKSIFHSWKGNVAKYNFPGPAVASFGGSGGSDGGDTGGSTVDDNTGDNTDAGTGDNTDDAGTAEDDSSTTGTDEDDDCTDEGDDSEDSGSTDSNVVTVTVTKTVTVAAKQTGKSKRHGPNRIPFSHFSE